MAILVLLSCKDDKKPVPTPIASSVLAAASSAPVIATATVTPSPAIAADGGLCKIDLGPFAMDFVGAAAIVPKTDGAQIIGNDKGTPHIVTIAGGKAPAAPSIVRTSSIACASAHGQTFCPDSDGKIRLADKIIAESRPGSRIAAAEVGGHAIVGYNKDRKTTEGTTQTAEIWSDDGTTQHLSDDGNGATALDLAARDGEALALTIDAHMGMTPIHARTLKWIGKLVLGPDTVLMVGGNAEAHTWGTLATKHDTGPSFALVPIAKDISAFGVVSLRIDGTPKMDAAQDWSLYDNGLDPAPIAATHDSPRMFVVRLRPTGKEPRAPRVLELGSLDASGRFGSLGIVHGSIASVAIAGDASGVWLAYTDDGQTTVEHRVCP